MPPTFTHEGLAAAAICGRRHPALGILLLSQSLESRYVADLRGPSGGFGYLLKDRVSTSHSSCEALRTMSRGGTALDPEVVAHLLGRDDLADQLARLSAREREVLELMAQGRSNRAVARSWHRPRRSRATSPAS